MFDFRAERTLQSIDESFTACANIEKELGIRAKVQPAKRPMVRA